MVRSRLIVAVAVAASLPALAAAPSLDIEIGKALFERGWVSAPASSRGNDGLGPLFDARSCLACHAERGPGLTPAEDGFARVIIRLGNGTGSGDPVYGHQLQLLAGRDVAPEVQPEFSWQHEGGLRRPALGLQYLGYGPLAASTRVALRRSSPLTGIGVLDRIPDDEILKLADADDANRDGISGRAAWLDDGRGGRALGRFGWRAAQATLVSQTEVAFANDIGMSTTGQPEAWGECTVTQTDCRVAPHGAIAGEVEIPDSLRDRIVDFLKADVQVTPPPSGRGAELFEAVGCAACHADPRQADGARSFIFSDLLLHDMGPELNDGIREGAAAPGEWRTQPLRRLSVILRDGGLLHDGRARDVAEAIEWHGGEAAASRARTRALSAADKASLLAFVNGL
jgi:CxxC motif-containing protein (DUF1111 family)